jgi:hypothetical protein
MARRLALLVSLLTASPRSRPGILDERRRPGPSVTDPQVSPDGRLVAYVVESLNREKDAYQTDVWPS